MENITTQSTTRGMNPKRFNLWLIMISIFMMFAALTSGYLVKRNIDVDMWDTFKLPSMFHLSTAVIIVSSVFMQLAYQFAKKDKLKMLRINLTIALVLGLAFLFLQVEGWRQMNAMDVYLEGSPSGGFLYIITGLHGAHIVSAIIFVLIVWWRSLIKKVHAKSLLAIDMCNTYWHYLGLLWIFLYIFLSLYR